VHHSFHYTRWFVYRKKIMREAMLRIASSFTRNSFDARRWGVAQKCGKPGMSHFRPTALHPAIESSFA
jgi:hypothetical protein